MLSNTLNCNTHFSKVSEKYNSRTDALTPQRLVARKSQRSHQNLCVAAAQKEPGVMVKVCGVCSGEDALYAAQQGADYIGLIVWPGSKRSVEASLAKEIVAAARQGGAIPVGVFVTETAEQILEAVENIGFDIAQLHGDESRRALAGLPTSLRTIYAMSADPEGNLLTSLPGQESEAFQKNSNEGEKGWRKASDWMSRGRRTVDYLLVDGVHAGSGETYDWTNIKVPRGASKRGWILAGGLNPDNVTEALRVVKPTVADVSSGVTLSCGIKKDPLKVKAFIDAVKQRQ